MTIYKKLEKIQKELKAPKGQFNKFGGYAYRSQEDILEAVKPLLDGLVLLISDEIVEVGGRVYVKATATLTDGDIRIENSAFAREQLTRKGMDEAQLTGATSSYARKYALNGLFAIDDVKDADTMERPKPVTAQELQALIKQTSNPEETQERLLEVFKKTSLHALSQAELRKAILTIKSKLK